MSLCESISVQGAISGVTVIIAVVIASAAGAQSPAADWSVAAIDDAADGYMRVGGGNYQWLDRRCLASLRAARVPVQSVKQADINGLNQVYGIASCERIARLLGGTNDRPWSVVTTSGKGDGFVLFGDNTRQWLDVPCVARLREAGLTVKSVTWDSVKSMRQIPGVGDCDKVRTRTVKTGARQVKQN